MSASTGCGHDATSLARTGNRARDHCGDAAVGAWRRSSLPPRLLFQPGKKEDCAKPRKGTNKPRQAVSPPPIIVTVEKLGEKRASSYRALTIKAVAAKTQIEIKKPSPPSRMLRHVHGDRSRSCSSASSCFFSLMSDTCNPH
jgi:hypothetical protein